MEERELRYRVPRCAVEDLLKLSALGLYTLKKALTLRTTDIYLDTPSRTMAAALFSLRLRKKNKTFLVTLKGTPAIHGALTARLEMEAALPKLQRNPARWPEGDPRESVLRLVGSARLETVACLKQIRTTALVLRGAEEVAEYSLDQVTLNAGEAPIYMLECECLPAGTPADLDLIDLLLIRQFALLPEPLTKLQLAQRAADHTHEVADLPAALAAPRAVDNLELRYGIEPVRAGAISKTAVILFDKLRIIHNLPDKVSESVPAAARLRTSLERLPKRCRSAGVEQLTRQPIEGLPDEARFFLATSAASISNIDSILIPFPDDMTRQQAEVVSAIIRLAGALSRRPRRDLQVTRITAKPGVVRISVKGAGAAGMVPKIVRSFAPFKQLYGTLLDINVRDAAQPDAANEPITEQPPVASEAGRILAQLDEKLDRSAEAARQGSDPEAVHDLRVTSRRLRSTFDLMQPVLPQDLAARTLALLRACTQRLGAVRDAEVQLGLLADYVRQAGLREQPAMDALLSIRQHTHDAARDDLLTYLKQPEYDDLNKALQDTTAYLRAFGQGMPDGGTRFIIRHLQKSLKRVLAYRRAIHKTPLEELHRLRIHCKRLRYSLESAGEVTAIDFSTALSMVEDLQTHLGTLHDFAVAIDLLCQAADTAAQTVAQADVAAVRAYYLEQMHAAYRRFLPAWRTFCSRDNVNGLRNKVLNTQNARLV